MDGGGGEVILSGRERERERVMVVATTSPPLIFLSLNFDLSLRFCSCKGRQCGELRDGDCTLLTLRQPCRIFQHCPSLYGSCSYHAMSSVHCIINCRTRPGPCTNRPPSSYFAFGFVLCQCHHALKTHKTNLRPLLNHQHINVYF